MSFINYSSRIVGILFLILFVAYGWFASQIPLDFWSEKEVFNARSMPYLIAVAGSLVSLLLVLVPQINLIDERFHKFKWMRFAGLVLLMVGYGMTIELLGFILASSLLLLTGYWIMGERRFRWLLLASVPLVLAFYLVLSQLGIYLETGTIFEVLG